MGKFLDDIWIGDEREAAEILKSAGEEDLFEKGRPRKHQVGDTHPFNANLIWTDLGNGSYGWRSRKGKFHSNVKPPINRSNKERRRRPVGAGTLGIEPRLKRKKRNGDEKRRKRKEEGKPKS